MTEDNSITLHSEFFDENCHSTSGAVSETDFNYIEGCEVVSKARAKKEMTIFEVGFGLGMGAVRTYEHLKSEGARVHFLSCELDEGLILWAISNDSHPLIQGLVKESKNNSVFYTSTLLNFTLTVLVGDIRKTLNTAHQNNLFNKFTAIYQDAFSPRKNPILWTLEWFRELKEHAADDCILSTYSAAMPVRKGLLEAGWSVLKREGYGYKRSTTIGKINVEMVEEFLRNMNTSPESPLSDELLINKSISMAINPNT